jgi:hypothetical protein
LEFIAGQKGWYDVKLFTRQKKKEFYEVKAIDRSFLLKKYNFKKEKRNNRATYMRSVILGSW